MAHDTLDGSEQSNVQPPVQTWGRLFVTRRCCGAGTCRNYASQLFGEVTPPTAMRRVHRRASPTAITGTRRCGACRRCWLRVSGDPLRETGSGPGSRLTMGPIATMLSTMPSLPRAFAGM